MTTSTTSSRARRHASGHGVRAAVQTAVSAAHHSRPAADAPASEQAVWWTRTAGALALLAENEADPMRAESARADAAMARRLAEGMAHAHSTQVLPEPAPLAEDAADVTADLGADDDVLEAWL